MDYAALLERKRQQKLHLDVDDFLADCAGYFQWATDHPLKEEQLFHHKGAIVRGDKDKVRAFTKRGLCAHLGMSDHRLALYANRGDEWADAVAWVEDVIYTQKFENAAAGLLNASIIGRDLGLSEKSELTAVPGAGDGTQPLPVFTIVPIQSGTFLPPEPDAAA